MAVRPEQKGTVRVGSFELFERIGRGGMGVVYRALHLPSSTPSAVKVITTESARSPTLGSILHREVQTTAMLTHPAIIEIYDYGVIEDTVVTDEAADGELVTGSPFLAMELAETGSLNDVMSRESLDWFDIRTLLLTLLDALSHAHARKLIHCDLKPDNILCFGRGGGRRWKLTDFGIAQSLRPPNFGNERAGAERTDDVEVEVAGTPLYMAPEQFVGSRRDLAPTTDLYALGCLADAPILFCATVQIEALGERPAMVERVEMLAERAPVSRIELARLSKAQTNQLITALLRIEDALVRRIAQLESTCRRHVVFYRTLDQPIHLRAARRDAHEQLPSMVRHARFDWRLHGLSVRAVGHGGCRCGKAGGLRYSDDRHHQIRHLPRHVSPAASGNISTPLKQH